MKRWMAALLGLTAGVWGTAVYAGTVPAAWQLGMEVVPVAHLPGAKVRTPARLEMLLAQTRMGRWDVRAAPSPLATLAAQDITVWMGPLLRDVSLPDAWRQSPLGWSASPMAIMRSDTRIGAWQQLRDRTVCLARDGRYVGELAARFKAREQVYPSVADALLALRAGLCDATVQDEGLLRELLRFPEWKKFSAQLAPYRHEDLTVVVRDDVPVPNEFSQAVNPAKLRALARQQAKDIAFEVYLDQVVPDCH